MLMFSPRLAMSSMVSRLKLSPIFSNMLFTSEYGSSSRTKGFFEDDLAHLLLDALEILVGEVPVRAVEIVVEAVVDRGAERDLRAGEQPLHRVGHHVGGGVADDLPRTRIIGTHRLELRAFGDRRMQIDNLVADEHGHDVLAELLLGLEELARRSERLGHEQGGMTRFVTPEGVRDVTGGESGSR